ncbi:ABC transporter permease [Puia sp.]|jgi:predicted permease|uniref:ABC transporter permease n=1 Tax=Puia sp. TaxID=2045100 RepID=UPI002F40D172
MFWNQIKLAWRNLSKNRFFTGLNILGLGLGMACSLLILLWVMDERSMDALNTNRDRLYVAYSRGYGDGKITGDYELPALLGEELKRVLPDVEYAATVDRDYNNTFRAAGKSLKANGGFAGRDFFHLFSFPLEEGNADNALNTPNAIAISREMAVRFFGTPQAAIGQTLSRDSLNRWTNFTVTAVFDNPDHSTLHFDFLINWQQFLKENNWMNRWDNSGPSTYLALRAGTNPEAVRVKMKDLLQRQGEHPVPGHHTELDMQVFKEKYLHGNFNNGVIEGGRIGYVRLFTIVAVFILLIACINFMNLTTARSMKRAREIGVRKVIGAKRGSLIRQFLGEAVLLAFLAVVLALTLTIGLLPAFNSIAGKTMSLPLGDWSFWLQILGLTLLTGCVAGSYPALFLSSFQPIKVLKGTMVMGSGATQFRKGLVVFQFVLSIILIIGTLVITQQVNYLQKADTGYSRDNLVYLPLQGRLTDQYPAFREQAVQLPGIRSISCMNNTPTVMDNGTISVEWAGKPANYLPSFTQASVGYDFTATTGIRVLQGRDFSRDYPTDSSNYILNEAAVRLIGFKEPVGREITFWGRKGKIIGVIKDFHFASLHDPIYPLILRFNEHAQDGYVLVKIAPGATRQALGGLERLSKAVNPAFPFTYQFSDEQYQKFYASEQVIGRLSHYFAGLAILISCMGLLGLTLYTAEQRTREIGIRKVLGAGAPQLFLLLSRDFLLLVLLAFGIATPIAWWAMQHWLGDYAYHIPLGATVFLVAGIAAFGIAMLTVSYHSFRTARANPVRALRSE